MTRGKIQDQRRAVLALLLAGVFLAACGGGNGREDAAEEGDGVEAEADGDEARDDGGDAFDGDPADGEDEGDEAAVDGGEDAPLEVDVETDGEADLPLDAPDGDGPQDVPADDSRDSGEDGAEEACECGSDEDCDTGNPCVMSLCSPTTCLCYDYDLPDYTPCPDDVFCDGEELCTGGSCAPASEPACKPTGACMQVTCDEASDACDEEPAPDGTPCDDGSWCTGADACSAGGCVHAPRCLEETGDPCTYFSCNETARSCDELTLSDGEECNDGNVCTLAAACQAGLCLAHDTACDDSIPCSDDHCAPDGGGSCVEVTVCP
jgi:hypothetical protein